MQKPARNYYCQICNKEFNYKTTRGTITCSKECFKKYLSNIRIGELNPRFNNGCRQWKRIKKDIKSCENCGRKYKLEIHHKDANQKNNNPDNLIKLCRRCHMILDNRIKTFNKNTWNKGRKGVYSKQTLEKMSKAKKNYWFNKHKEVV